MYRPTEAQKEKVRQILGDWISDSEWEENSGQTKMTN